MSTRRAGFTLVELLVVLALLIPLWAAAMGLAAHATRAGARAAGLAAAEEVLASAAAALGAELGEAPGNGLLELTPDRVRFHSPRATGRWCLIDSAGIVLPTAAADWGASRLPVPGRDSVWLDTLSVAASGPVRLRLSGSPVGEPCPDGRAGLRLPVAGLASFAPGVRVGPVVRTGEVMEVSGYLSGGETWLGLRHVGTGETVQPVAGPFATGGVWFEGLDRNGVPTLDPAAVAGLRIRLETAPPLRLTREVWLVLPD